jgi:hypothetical protein
MDETEREEIWEGTPTEHEQAVREEVQALELFTLLDAVSAVLAVAIDRASATAADGVGAGIRKQAVLAAAVRAFRAMRCASAVIASGYPLEAESYTRMLLELFVSAKAVIEDETDEEAKMWLAGERGWKIGGRVRAAMANKSVYMHLSQGTHGDPRALTRALLRETDRGQVIDWGPARTPQTEEQLLQLALGAREFAVLLEEVGFERQSELDGVDIALQRFLPGWRPSVEQQEGGAK